MGCFEYEYVFRRKGHLSAEYNHLILYEFPYLRAEFPLCPRASSWEGRHRYLRAWTPRKKFGVGQPLVDVFPYRTGRWLAYQTPTLSDNSQVEQLPCRINSCITDFYRQPSCPSTDVSGFCRVELFPGPTNSRISCRWEVKDSFCLSRVISNHYTHRVVPRVAYYFLRNRAFLRLYSSIFAVNYWHTVGLPRA